MNAAEGIGASVGAVADMVQELIAVGLLVEHEAEDQRYWQVTGWQHQKIGRPTNKFPRSGGVDSTPPRRAIDESSTSPQREIDEASPSEGKGKGRDVSRTLARARARAASRARHEQTN